MSYRKKHYPPKPEKAQPQSPFSAEYGDPSVLQMLPSSALTSGLGYQRPVRESDVDRLVREWDENLLDPLIVSFRDGHFNVVDGQHRITAMHRMNGGRDVMVLCRVYNGLTYQQEAELCVKLDKSKKPLSMAQSVNALMVSGSDQDINEIQRLMKSRGFSWAVEKKSARRYQITATSVVLRAYKLLGASLFDRMLLLLDGAWTGNPDSLNAYMISGVALLLKTYETELKDDVFIQRLSAFDPQEIVRRSKADFSTDSKALRCARVLREKYNGRKGGNKLPYRFNN